MFNWTLWIISMFTIAVQSIAQRDLEFIENKGQWPLHVIAASTIGGHQVFVEEKGFTYNVRNTEAISMNHQQGKTYAMNHTRISGHIYHVDFVGCHAMDSLNFQRPSAWCYNYFLDPDSLHWGHSCKAFSRIKRKSLYPGIDLMVHSESGLLKYDFIVTPSSNPSSIQMKYIGVDCMELVHNRILLHLSSSEVYEQAPIAWQIIDGLKIYVPCQYQLRGDIVTFELPNGYNDQWPLIIDPQIVFSTYSGSTSDNFGYSATYDEDGNLYSGSSAFGQGYPTTLGAYQLTHAGGDSPIQDGIDMALTKYSGDGTTMIWSTFVGGSGDDLPHSLVVNSNDELYVYGCTGSSDFPVTTNTFQDQFLGGSSVSPVGTGATFPNGTDMVLLHLNASGSALLGSTYLGGSANDGINNSALLKRNYADEFRGEISLDENEWPIIVSSTFSTDFPTLNAFQAVNNGGQEAVFCKLNPSLTNLIHSSYLGGSGDDSGFSVAQGIDGSYYISGGTASANFPTTNNALQPNFNGVVDGYFVRVSNNGLEVIASTFYGADNFDQLYFVEIDDLGNVYGYGQTISPGNSLINNVGYGQSNSGVLLVKLEAELETLIWSTTIGTGDANPNLSPSAFLVDYCNRIYISGWGVSSINSVLNPGSHLFPMGELEVSSDAAFPTSTTGDFYMAVFDESMTNLEYATFYGGNISSEHVDGGTSRFDRKGVIYQSVCAGCGSNDDFPIAPNNAWSSTNNSTNCNNGVFKFDFQLPLTVADFSFENGCLNTPISFINSSTYAQTYAWDFGDGNFSNQVNPTHIYTGGGIYPVRLIVAHPLTCNAIDTLIQFIEIIVPGNNELNDVFVCENMSQVIGPTNPNPNSSYVWNPATFLSASNVAQPNFSAGSTTTYQILVNNGSCIDTLWQQVEVVELELVLPNDTVLCEADILNLMATYTPSDATILWSSEPDFSILLNDNNTDPDITQNVQTPSVFYAAILDQGCPLYDSVVVQMVSFQTVIEGDFSVCQGDTTLLEILSPNPLFDYLWGPTANILSGQHTSQVSVMVPQTMEFYVHSTYQGCNSSDTITILLSPLGFSNITATATPSIIVSGQTAQLYATPSGYQYQWWPMETLENSTVANPMASPTETTTYAVMITDGECVAMDSVTVRVVEFVCGPPSIFVPNAFTPNVDQANEVLYVRANNIDALYFVIYDRWGEKVFETTQLHLGWDGSYEGKLLPPDVYTYYLEATCEGGSTYFDKGNITLIR
jgi:gliding motility-associated-like protein